MKQFYLLSIGLIFSSFSFSQNVGIGTSTPNASAKLEISSTNSGILIPRVALNNVTNNLAPVVSPATGLMVYNTNAFVTGGSGTGFYFWDGTIWQKLNSGTQAYWSLLGNAGTVAATNFIGTTDAVDFVTRTSNLERMRVTAAGNVGIGTNPGDKLDVIANGGRNVLIGGGASTGSEIKLTYNGVRHWSIYNSGNGNLTFSDASSAFATNTVGTPRMVINGVGNVGIGTTTPSYSLDLANGSFAFGNSNVRSETRDNAGLQGNAGAQSGFFETSNPVNYPAGATSWWHLIDTRHSNNGNNYAMQIAGSFFDQNFWVRKTNNNAAQAWQQLLTSSNGWMTTGNAGTVAGANFIGTIDAVDFVTRTNNAERVRVTSGGNVGIGTAAPTYQLTLGATGNVFGVENTASFVAKNAGGGYETYLWPRWSDNIMYLNYGANGFHIRNNASTSTMFMTNAGNVGIATTTPVYKLQTNGDIYANGGWFRVSGNQGYYFETWGGGWYMQDATWIRNYNNKKIYINTNSGDNSIDFLMDQEGGTQDHGIVSENDTWGYVGYSNQRWWAMYAANGFGTSSIKYKQEVYELTDSDLNKQLENVKNIQSITYKWNKDVLEKENGSFIDNKYHPEGEKPVANQKVPIWLGFSVESLPEGTVDESGENFHYGAMFGLLIASEKALIKKVELLEKSNADLKTELEKTEQLARDLQDMKKQLQELKDALNKN